VAITADAAAITADPTVLTVAPAASATTKP
jgi:hypothetical protein